MTGDRSSAIALLLFVSAAAGLLWGMASLSVAELIVIKPRESVDDSKSFQTYYRLIESAEHSEALKVGGALLDKLDASCADSPARNSLKARLAAIGNCRDRLVYKLDMIARKANEKRPGPFLYIAPKPAGLFEYVNTQLEVSVPEPGRLTKAEWAFAASYLKTARSLADRSALRAYVRVLDAGAPEQARLKARQYLTAYTVGTHGASDLPEVLSLLSQELSDNGLPVFVIEDVMAANIDLKVACAVVDVLDNVEWAAWPRGQRRGLLTGIAELSQRSGNYVVAADAYYRIADADSGVEAEDALLRAARIHAEHAEALKAVGKGINGESGPAAAYRRGVFACSQYLVRFPEGRHAASIAFLKGVYQYRAGDYAQAIASCRGFRRSHSDSSDAPNALLIEGLSQLKLGDAANAAGSFRQIIEEHAGSDLAERAYFMSGYAYMATREYEKAAESFRRVVDFYPGSADAGKAREMLEQVEFIRARRL